MVRSPALGPRLKYVVAARCPARSVAVPGPCSSSSIMALGFPGSRGLANAMALIHQTAWHMWGIVAATLQRADLATKYIVRLLSYTCTSSKTSYSGMAHNHQYSASSAIHMLLALHSFYGVLFMLKPRLHITGLWLFSASKSLNARFCTLCTSAHSQKPSM